MPNFIAFGLLPPKSTARSIPMLKTLRAFATRHPFQIQFWLVIWMVPAGVVVALSASEGWGG